MKILIMKNMKNFKNMIFTKRCESIGTHGMMGIQIANISTSSTSVKRGITLKNHQ